MNIINHDVRKGLAVLTMAALLSLSSAPAVFAAGDISMSGAVAGSTVLAQNGSATELATFSPDLHLVASTNASLEQSATSSTHAYYGVDVTAATSSPNVHWRITVHHASSALASGDVMIQEVGTYDADSGHVRSSPATYATTESSGDLVLNGNISGWSVNAGDQFTNVDEIIFASGAPTGMYTVTRSLINEDNGNTPFDAPFAFTVNLTEAATSTGTTTPDVTPPAPPVVTFPVSPASTSTNPVTVYGTAEANSSIAITGGVSTSTASTTGAGNWSSSVNLTASSTNTLLITAADASGNTSAPTTLVITHSASSTGTTTPPTGTSTPPTASSSPMITLHGDNPLFVFSCNGFIDPGFTAADASGTPIVASSTSSTNNVNIEQAGVYTVTYTATDSHGNTGTTTRTVNVLACSSGSHSGGGSSSGGSSSSNSTGSVIAGEVLGASTIFGLPGIPATGGGVSFQFLTDLSFGMTSEDVATLQTLLSELGYFKGPITGYFGPLTRAALMKLQRANGLSATGILDAQTRFFFSS